MRTTIKLDDHLVAQAKKIAADSGRSLSEVVEDALRAAIASRAAARKSAVRLKTVKGTGTLPGVDLDSGAALLELMEDR
jgi:Arc/MetJ family transcription regulator